MRDVPRGVLKSATRRAARASQPALEVSVSAFARVRATQNRRIARIRTLRGSAGGRVKRQRSGEVPRRVLDSAIGDERFPQRVRHFRTQHRSKPQNGSSSTRSVPARTFFEGTRTRVRKKLPPARYKAAYPSGKSAPTDRLALG